MDDNQMAKDMNQSLPRVMFVDDEPMVLRSLKMAFKFRYDVSVSKSAYDAQAMLEKGDQFDVIVSDERMPQRTGHEFLKWAKDNSPQSVRILLTGTDFDEQQESVKPAQIYKCLSKPWNINEFTETLDQAVEISRILSKSLGTVDCLLENTEQQCYVVALEPDLAYKRQYVSATLGLGDITDTLIINSVSELMPLLEKNPVGIFCMDLCYGHDEVLNTIANVHKAYPATTIIVTGDPASVGRFTQSIDSSIDVKYLVKPMSVKRIQPLITKAAEDYLVALK